MNNNLKLLSTQYAFLFFMNSTISFMCLFLLNGLMK